MVHDHLNDANMHVQLSESEYNSNLSDAVADFFEVANEAQK